MATHHDGDNLPPDGDRPPDEPRDRPELPSLPDGIVIPDDASALAAEADQVRAELSGQVPAASDAAADASDASDAAGAGHPAGTGREPAPAMPFVIMAMAIVITMVSLIAMAWSGTTPPTAADAATPLPGDVVLAEEGGQWRNVATLAPMVLLMVEGCRGCQELVDETAARAPAGVTVVVVTGSADGDVGRPDGAPQVVRLVDPDGELRSALGLRPPPANAATVVLADREQVIRTTPSTTTVESFADAMATLANR